MKVKLKILDDLKKLKDNTFLNDVAQKVVQEMKEQIAVGISPVAGVGRFVAYSSQRNDNPKGYPFNVLRKFPDKKVRPVNLELSGEMLDALTFKESNGGIFIGIFNPAQAEKSQKHQVGDAKTHVPPRRFLPTAKGEKLNSTLTRLIKQMYSDGLTAIMKKK